MADENTPQIDTGLAEEPVFDFPVEDDSSTDVEPETSETEPDEPKTEVTPPSTEDNWEVRAKYFESEFHKMQQEQEKYEDLQKLDEYLRGNPDVVEKLQKQVSEPDVQEPQRPEDYDPYEAVNDPNSTSAQYDRVRREYEMKQMEARIRTDLERQYQAQAMQQQQMMELSTLAQKENLTSEQTQQFIQFTSNPQGVTAEHLLQLFKMVNGLGAAAPPKSDVFEKVKQNAGQPADVITARGEAPEERSDGDMFIAGMKGSNGPVDY